MEFPVASPTSPFNPIFTVNILEPKVKPVVDVKVLVPDQDGILPETPVPNTAVPEAAIVNVNDALEKAKVPLFVLTVRVLPALLTPIPPYVEFITVPCQTPVAIVPSAVNEDVTTVEFRVVPVSVPAAAVTVISALPLKETPFMFREVCKIVAEPALPLIVLIVTAPVKLFTELTPVTRAVVFPFNFCIACKIVSLELIVPAPDEYPVNVELIALEFV